MFLYAYKLFMLCRQKLQHRAYRTTAQMLIERITCWSAKHPSYAGREKLIQTVLQAMHSYWVALFLLSTSILTEVDRCCREFLWGQRQSGQCRALVNWSRVCTEKQHGGLGLRECRHWNMALVAKQLWAITAKKDSLWIK